MLSNYSGLLYMAASAFSFGVMALCVKLAGKNIPPHELILFRSVFILLVTLPVILRRGRRVFGTHYGRLIARGVFGWIALGAYYWTLTKMGIGDAIAIQYTNPVFTTLFAGIFLRERMSAYVWVALGACLAGVMVLARPEFAADPWVIAIGLGSAVCTGIAYTLVRSMHGREDALTIVFYFPLVSVPLSLIPALHSWETPKGDMWWYILGACAGSYLGQIFLTKSFQREPAGRVVVVNYLIIILGGVFNAIFFGEPVTGTSIAGMLVIMLALGLLTFNNTRASAHC